ncbi:flavocytochrome c [Spirochaetia bacterium]|nr:flavocytochrome c [Spirochaetia bacterium]
MQKIFKMAYCGILTVILLLACQSTSNRYSFIPGIYEGEANGFGGPVKLSVEVDAGNIKAISILEHHETPGIGSIAIEQLPDNIIRAQSLGIDGISGATLSSNAIFSALKSALSTSGINLAQLSRAPAETGRKTVSKELHTQYLIIGAGGAGLTAAIAAAQNGLDVLVLEKMPYAGGATAMSGAGTTATGSQWQIKTGTQDSPEWLFMDMLKNGHFYNNPKTTWFFANNAGKSFDWLVSPEGAGVPYGAQLSGPSAEHRAGRTYSAAGGGPGLIENLVKKAESLGITIMYSTRAEELTISQGRITGARAGDQGGDKYQISADAVLLATGGYGANDDYVPEAVRKLPYAGSVSATGYGLIMAAKLGADSFNLDKINIQPHSIRLPDGRGQHTFQGILYVYFNTAGMLVSQDGVRIVNEQASNYDVLAAMKKEQQSYLIMDEPTYQKYIEIAVASRNFTKAQADEWLAANGKMTPVFARGQTLESLAEALHIPPVNLVKTVGDYNSYAAAGKDPDFGRRPAGAMASRGPYYGVAMDLRYYASLGGLRINDSLEVLDTHGQPMPGLYAAGEVVGGVNGDIYTSSTCVGWALTSGYQAGLEAVRKLKP